MVLPAFRLVLEWEHDPRDNKLLEMIKGYRSNVLGILYQRNVCWSCEKSSEYQESQQYMLLWFNESFSLDHS